MGKPLVEWLNGLNCLRECAKKHRGTAIGGDPFILSSRQEAIGATALFGDCVLVRTS